MHVTGAEMTASALVHLFLALILNTEGTNCDLNNFFRFENFGGASQGILGNHASFLLDPSDINSTHHIWELDLDLKKCETFTETGDLPAQCAMPDTPWNLLYYLIFFSVFLCIEELCLSTQGEALCEYLRSAHTDLTDGPAFVHCTWSTTKYTRNRKNPLTEPGQTQDLNSGFMKWTPGRSTLSCYPWYWCQCFVWYFCRGKSMQKHDMINIYGNFLWLWWGWPSHGAWNFLSLYSA